MGGTAIAYPRAYGWQPEHPSAQMEILIYADDIIHTAPNTFPDQALRSLGLAYTAHYGGDWSGFETDLNSGTWDLVLFANDNYPPPYSTLTALDNYVKNGGRLVLHTWRVGANSSHGLWNTLGFVWIGDDSNPPDPVYWWEPGHPVFNRPDSVPEFTSLSGGIYGIYGQSVEPLADFQALAGYTTPGPDPNKAALIRGNQNRTLFRGFLDGQNSADRDADGILDGVELWINLIENTFGVTWLSVDPSSGTIPGRDSMNIVVTYDAAEMLLGDYFAELVTSSNDPDEPELTVPAHMRVVPRGDANGDFIVTLSDAVHLLNYLFKSGPAPDPIEAGDAYCDDKVDTSDIIYLINYLFKSGPPPCP